MTTMLQDHFGRPAIAILLATSGALLPAPAEGSVWPPPSRSICPPFDICVLKQLWADEGASTRPIGCIFRGASKAKALRSDSPIVDEAPAWVTGATANATTVVTNDADDGMWITTGTARAQAVEGPWLPALIPPANERRQPFFSWAAPWLLDGWAHL